MSDELDTKVDDTPDGQGNNDSDTEGKLDTDTSNQNKDQETEKRLTQTEVNEVVKKAKRDAENAAKTKFEKSLEGKHVLTEDELNARLKDAVTAALKEENMKSVRLSIQKEYGLNEHQVSKLEGDDEKSLREDANKTYGKPRKEAPVLNGASDTKDGEIPSTLAQRTQQQLQELKRKHHIKI